jgi:hypothetical protein
MAQADAAPVGYPATVTSERDSAAAEEVATLTVDTLDFIVVLDGGRSPCHDNVTYGECREILTVGNLAPQSDHRSPP